MPTEKKSKTIKVDYLARVEGEGALWIDIQDHIVKNVQLKIFEPPRFFEAFLQGRQICEAPDITARICGICPVAYQMSAVHAVEKILEITIPNEIRELRRLIYCGEWIESHGLHIYMLHAPDFLGYPDAIQMAKDFPDIVQNGLKMKKFGNELIKVIGGREVHPINVKIGGFYKLPKKQSLLDLRAHLLEGLKIAKDTVEWVSTFNYPDFEMNYEFVSLHHFNEYPMNEGHIISNLGLNIDSSDFENHFAEKHIEHSNALHCVHLNHGCYMVGPMARFNLNYLNLPDSILSLAKKVGLSTPCQNPFKSIMVRSIELVYAFQEALRIIEAWNSPGTPFVESTMRAGTGCAVTEAPRGLLYHRYEANERGEITKAKIIAPTSQNQMQIETDLYQFVSQYIHLPDDELTLKCEQAVRNYDPCISCATHFLKLHLNRDSKVEPFKSSNK